jgi:hypothetical protein
MEGFTVVIEWLHNLPETSSDLNKRSVIAVGECEDRQIQNCHKLARKKTGFLSFKIA